MTRQNATNYTGVNQFPYANAPTDLFKKEDVQVLALATDNHDHSPGLGKPIAASSIPTGLITGAMIADGTIQNTDIAANGVWTVNLADRAVTSPKIAVGAVINESVGAGVIDSGKIAAGGVAMTNLALNATFKLLYSTQAAPSGSTSSSTPAALPVPYNAMAIIVQGGNSVVLLLATINCVHSVVGGAFTLYCCADSTGLQSVGQTVIATAGGSGSITVVYAFSSLPAGAHQINLGWATGAGTLSMNTNVYSEAFIFEFSR